MPQYSISIIKLFPIQIETISLSPISALNIMKNITSQLSISYPLQSAGFSSSSTRCFRQTLYSFLTEGLRKKQDMDGLCRTDSRFLLTLLYCLCQSRESRGRSRMRILRPQTKYKDDMSSFRTLRVRTVLGFVFEKRQALSSSQARPIIWDMI